MLIPKIVITGGPCGGKSTGMKQVAEYLTSLGFRVFIAEEAATVFFLGGAKYDDLKRHQCQIAFQQCVYRFQYQLEQMYETYAISTGQPSVILCDRGSMDSAAYMSKEDFLKLLHDEGTNEIEARDCRYDAVFHLTTAADGAIDHYTLENNAARTETAEEAIAIDRRTQFAWKGHPYHVILNNKNISFSQKINYLKNHIEELLYVKTRIIDQAYVFPYKYNIKQIPEIDSPMKFILKLTTVDMNPSISAILSREFLWSYTYQYSSIILTQRTNDCNDFSSYFMSLLIPMSSFDESEKSISFKKAKVTEQHIETTSRRITSHIYNELCLSGRSSASVLSVKSSCYIYDSQSFQIIDYSDEMKCLLCFSDASASVESLPGPMKLIAEQENA